MTSSRPMAGPAPLWEPGPRLFPKLAFLGLAFQASAGAPPPPGVTPSLPQASLTWPCFMSPSLWIAHRPDVPPSALWTAGRCPGGPVHSIAPRAVFLGRKLLFLAPTGQPFTGASPLGRGGPCEGLCEGGSCSDQDGPGSCLGGRAGQHLPETSTRQASFPGFLPPGHFHVSKPDPGPLASAFSLGLSLVTNTCPCCVRSTPQICPCRPHLVQSCCLPSARTYASASPGISLPLPTGQGACPSPKRIPSLPLRSPDAAQTVRRGHTSLSSPSSCARQSSPGTSPKRQLLACPRAFAHAVPLARNTALPPLFV